MYKYKIKMLLDGLKYEDYKIMRRRLLPEILQISHNSLGNYANIKADDHRDIPYQVGRKLEIIFGLEPGKLSNVDCVTESFPILIQEHKDAQKGKPPRF